jgi:hypothetical protein
LPQQFLNSPDIVSGRQKMRGKTMTQCVRRYALTDGRIGSSLPNSALNGLLADAMPPDFT